MKAIKPWGAGISLLMAAMISGGCGGGGAVQQDQDPPTLNNLALTPGALRFPGGEVTITATVADPSGVEGVRATVTRPDQSSETVNLGDAGGGNYSGTFTAPANTRSNGVAASYPVNLRARDKAGNETPLPGLAAGAFRVNAPSAPPGEPSF